MKEKSVKQLLVEYPDFRPLLKAKTNYKWKIIDKINELLIKNISASKKEIKDKQFFLYNYNRLVLTQRNHQLLMKCRGLVLDECGVIYNFPFERFFNDFEKESTSLDWTSAKVHEKIDGTLICVWYIEDTGWQVTTRGAFYPLENKNTVDFELLFKKHFNKFDMLDKDFNYMFELVTKKNPIVKLYSSEFVVLLGMRNRNTLKESNQNELDSVALKTAVKRPKIYHASNLLQVKKLFDDLKDDDEGLVIVDKKFNRIKIKQESYIRMSKIKNLSNEDIFNYVIGKSSVDIEFLERMKDVQEKIAEIKKNLIKINIMVSKIFNEISESTTDRKNFSEQAMKYNFKSLLFLLYDDRPIFCKINWKTYNIIVRSLNSTKKS